MAAPLFRPLTTSLDGADDNVLTTWRAGEYATDARFSTGYVFASAVAQNATDKSTHWSALSTHLGRDAKQQIPANRRRIMKRLTSQGIMVLNATDFVRFCRGGDPFDVNAANNPAHRIPRKLRVFVVLAAYQLIAGLLNGSLGPRVASLCARAARIAQAASAEGQANIRLRVGARIADANTSDDAAFNVAKDGEAAIAALNGAAAAERRRMIGKRKRGGAFALAGSF